MNKILISLILLCFANGCGVYTFTGHGIGGIKSISVETFDNQTAEYGIREDLTDIIVQKLLADKTLTVVDRNSADAILYGNILSIVDNPLSYSGDESVSEYEIKITISFALRKPDQSEPIWEDRLVGSGSYPFKTGSLEERTEGIKKASDIIAQDLINKLTSDW